MIDSIHLGALRSLTPCTSRSSSPISPRTPGRFCACVHAWASAAHIIEPAGFPISDRHFRRAGMDYLDQVALTRHDLSWQKFEQWRNEAGSGWCCLRPGEPAPIWISLPAGTMSCCSGEIRRGTGSRRRRRCAAGNPDQAGLALAQCGHGGGHGIGRGIAADGSPGWRARSVPRRSVSYAVKEIFPDLAGRRRACRPRGGVLPFFRLQPLERPRTGPRQRHLQVLRYRLCRHRRYAGRPLRQCGRTGRNHRRAMDRRQYQPRRRS